MQAHVHPVHVACYIRCRQTLELVKQSDLSSRVLKSFRARCAVKLLDTHKKRKKYDRPKPSTKSEFADEEFAHNANLLYRRRKRSLRTPDLTNATSITITIVSTTSLLFFFYKRMSEKGGDRERRRRARARTIRRLVWKFNEADVRKLREKNYSTRA